MSSSSPPHLDGHSLLDEVLDRRHVLHRAASAHKWALGNLLGAGAIGTEIHTRLLCRQLLGVVQPPQVVTVALYALAILFLTNVAVDLIRYFLPLADREKVLLNHQQMRLLRVSEKDPGFGLSPEKTAPAHPNPFSPPLEGSFIEHSSHPISPQSPSFNFSSTLASPASGGPPDTSSNNASMTSSSWIFHSSSPPGVRRRSTFNAINCEDSLREYLEEYEAWERQTCAAANVAASAETSAADTTLPSFWKPTASTQSPRSAIQDYSPILARLSYQVSTPMPNSNIDNNSKDGKSVVAPGTKTDATGLGQKSETLCRRLGIDPLELVGWKENLRLWISQTILVRLVEEIDETNKQLSSLGVTDALVGEAGIEQLRRASRSPHSPSSLAKLLPFLEVSVRQDYVVARLRALAAGGAISEYHWDGGGRHKGAEWSADALPNDSELLMHCVASYLDARLPPAKGVIDGRVFTTLYFSRELGAGGSSSTVKMGVPGTSQQSSTTSSNQQQKKSFSCVIVQTSNRPPHFALRIKDRLVEVDAGRNNLLHTLLLFLHYIKTEEGGILGRVSLGRSGLNILWVIE